MKFVQFVKRHLFACIAILIFLIIFIVGAIIAKKLFFSNSGDEFGNRLEGIENYPISSSIEEAKNDIEESENVSNFSSNVVGKRVNIIIKVKNDTELEEAKKYGDKILEHFSEETKGFYDIQLMITCDDESDKYPIIGYKHKSKESFSW